MWMKMNKVANEYRQAKNIHIINKTAYWVKPCLNILKDYLNLSHYLKKREKNFSEFEVNIYDWSD